MSPAWQLGYEDGAEGAPFCPELFFGSAQRMAEYTAGFLAAQPGNPYALSWMANFEAVQDELREEERSLMRDQLYLALGG